MPLFPKRIHEFTALSSGDITPDTVFEVEKPRGGESFLLLETGDQLLLEDGGGLLLESSGVAGFTNYKVTYAELLARIILDLP